jgi:Fe-S cluster assembly protein SufD
MDHQKGNPARVSRELENVHSMIELQQNDETKIADPYLDSFERYEKNLSVQAPSWVFPLRKAAISHFADIGFPTLKDEDWRYTNVAPIAKLPFKPAYQRSIERLAAKTVSRFTFAGLKAHRLVFVNGQYSQDLSSGEPPAEGVRITNLAAALSDDAGLIQRHLARYASTENSAFAALNTAFFHDGAFIYVPAGKKVEQPVHLLFITTASEMGSTSHPRNLILAEKNSQLTVMESYVSTLDAPYFTNAVSEIVVGEGAVVEHCKFQDESLAAFHVAGLHAHLGRGCNLTAHSLAAGARLSRNNIRVKLDGEGINCVLNGLYLTKGEQLADHHMIVEHARPQCNSHEYFNGILDGRSRGVFHGRILVRPDAQKTDAKQTNKNLLLSDDATANTKPQLEIYADDVKCTHGATIGQLNEEAIFYLRARGIGLDTARQMLIHAFAGEIIDRIQCEPARKELDELIWDRLEQNPSIVEKKKH